MTIELNSAFVARTLSPYPLQQEASAILSVVVSPGDSLPAAFDYDVAVLGLGYVGLPNMLAFHAAGLRVLGIDRSDRRLAEIRCARVDLTASDRERLSGALAEERFELAADSANLQRAAAVVICVPTPVDAHQVPDLGPLGRACDTAVANAVPGQVLILTSTTYVGTTAELLARPLAARGLRPGLDVHVAFSPERINPGTDSFAHEAVPRVVGGITEECTRRAAEVVQKSTTTVHTVTSAETAEMSKLIENTFRAVNIALANEFADACGTLDLNVTEAIDAAATKPYGFMPFYPGPGVGGHCIPCDPHYLLWQMRRHRRALPVVEHAMNAIAGRPRRIVERAMEFLSAAGRSMHDARVLVVGVTYKPDVEDLRESPALEIVAELLDRGAVVAYFDPFVDELRLPSGQVLRSIADPRAAVPDLAIIHTAHSDLDLEWLSEAPIVLDATYRIDGLPAAVQP
ncbi:MAG TPA: nucleotide sugar dehydrogenase [Aldersonia sp.]